MRNLVITTLLIILSFSLGAENNNSTNGPSASIGNVDCSKILIKILEPSFRKAHRKEAKQIFDIPREEARKKFINEKFIEKGGDKLGIDNLSSEHKEQYLLLAGFAVTKETSAETFKIVPALLSSDSIDLNKLYLDIVQRGVYSKEYKRQLLSPRLSEADRKQLSLKLSYRSRTRTDIAYQATRKFHDKDGNTVPNILWEAFDNDLITEPQKSLLKYALDKAFGDSIDKVMESFTTILDETMLKMINKIEDPAKRQRYLDAYNALKKLDENAALNKACQHITVKTKFRQTVKRVAEFPEKVEERWAIIDGEK